MTSLRSRSFDSSDETRIPDHPGYDAWVVGDETFVAIEFRGAAGYAK